MNKKNIGILIFTLFISILTNNAFAGFEEFKMVGSSGSVTEKNVFDLNDPSPFLYMRLPKNGAAATGSFWRDPEAQYSFTIDGGTSRNRWVTLDNWSTIKKTGKWEVASSYFYKNSGAAGSGVTSFTVTPEPLSMVLFLLGGTPIAANLYRRRQRKS